MNQQAKTIHDVQTLKDKARELYIKNGMTAKQISRQIDVSENTLSKWVKQFGWRIAKRKRLEFYSDGIMLNEFRDFLAASNPPLLAQVNHVITIFQNQ